MKRKHAPGKTLASHSRPALARPPLRPTPRQRVLTLAMGLGVFLGVAGLAYAVYVFWPSAATSKKLRAAEEYAKLPAPKLNAPDPPGAAPEGMVWIPGGEFYMGIDESQVPEGSNIGVFMDALKVHKVYVDGFWMDTHEVTNEEFAKFVDATKYVTVAEKQPDPKDFPDVPAKELAPFSIVFKIPEQPIPNPFKVQGEYLWFDPVKGASWKHPEGPSSDLKGRAKHPVVHVCYLDALEYCKWANKRLPTEAEWEFAARGGLDRKTYCWGDELNPGKKWMCNNWQGYFPNADDKEDGFHGTAPVGSFPANGYGLYDMAGNVWEWCSDWYQLDYYENSPAKNPPGPKSGFDFHERIAKRVQRGGSFLCAENFCTRYLPGARGKGEPTSAASHVGFRCVRDASASVNKE